MVLAGSGEEPKTLRSLYADEKEEGWNFIEVGFITQQLMSQKTGKKYRFRKRGEWMAKVKARKHFEKK